MNTTRGSPVFLLLGLITALLLMMAPLAHSVPQETVPFDTVCGRANSPLCSALRLDAVRAAARAVRRSAAPLNAAENPLHFSGTLEVATYVDGVLVPQLTGSTDHSDVIALDPVGHTSVRVGITHTLHVSITWMTGGRGFWIAHATDRGSWNLTLPSGQVLDGSRVEAGWSGAGPLGAAGIYAPDLPSSGGKLITPVPNFVTLRTTARTTGGSATIGIGKVMLVFHTWYSADVSKTYFARSRSRAGSQRAARRRNRPLSASLRGPARFR